MEWECPDTSLVVGECDPWPSHGKIPQPDGAIMATCDHLSKNQSHYKTKAPTICTYQMSCYDNSYYEVLNLISIDTCITEVIL